MNFLRNSPGVFSHNSFLTFEGITKTGILLCALVVIAYCGWTLDRGFEITDEAYYLLLAMHADSVKVYLSAQQWITASLWHLSGSIVMFRGVGLVLLLTSSALLALGVFSTCRRLDLVEDVFASKTAILAGSAVGSLLYASTINLSPCYNLLASAGAYAAAGMILLASNRSSIIQKFVLFTLAGCAIGIEALSKLSSGVATLALLVFWIAIFERSHFGKFFGSVATLFGAGTFIGTALLVNTTIPDALQAVDEGLKLFRMVQIEEIGPRLIRYFIEYLGYLLTTLKAFAIPFIAMIGYAATHRTYFAHIGLLILLITLLFGSLESGLPTFSVQNIYFGSYLFGGFNRYDVQTISIFAMLMMALIVSRTVWNKSRSTLSLFIGLILLPYSVAIGTGNALFTQVIDSLAPWATIIAALVISRHPEDLSKKPISIIGVCFIVTVSLQIITSSVRPYHLSSPLTKQDQTVTIGSIGEMKVDVGTSKFLADVVAAAQECNIAPNSPFYGLYDIPGVALALQAIPVLTPWINNKTQARYVIDRVNPERLPSAVVALKMGGSGNFPVLPQQLALFPIGYQYCGMATYPYGQQRIKIWQSQPR